MPENTSDQPEEIEIIVSAELALIVRAGFDGDVKIHANVPAGDVAGMLRGIADEYEAWLAAQS